MGAQDTCQHQGQHDENGDDIKSHAIAGHQHGGDCNHQENEVGIANHGHTIRRAAAATPGLCVRITKLIPGL